MNKTKTKETGKYENTSKTDKESDTFFLVKDK